MHAKSEENAYNLPVCQVPFELCHSVTIQSSIREPLYVMKLVFLEMKMHVMVYNYYIAGIYYESFHFATFIIWNASAKINAKTHP